MTPEELLELIEQEEGLKLDFKREFYHIEKILPKDVRLDRGFTINDYVDTQWSEFIKDILAFANEQVIPSEQPALLVIGVGDKRDETGHRPLFDMRDLTLDPKQLLQKVNDACYPPVPDLRCDRVELKGKILHILSIPPTPFVHETIKPLITAVSKDEEAGPPAEGEEGKVRFVKRGNPYREHVVFVRRGEEIRPASEPERQALRVLKSQMGEGLERLILAREERDRIEKIFEPPTCHDQAREILGRKGIMWLIGPSGVGKQTLALQLALNHPEYHVYRVPRFFKWADLARAHISKAVLVFPDALGAVRFERESLEAEFGYLEELRKHGNLIIVTSPDEVFEEACKETELGEWLSTNNPLPLDAAAYSPAARLEMFWKNLDHAFSLRVIPGDLYEWANETTGRTPGSGQSGSERRSERDRVRLKHLIEEEWLPLDMQRFIASLGAAGSVTNASALLYLDSDTESRVRAWFFNLDESTRCFILVLTILAGSEPKRLWGRYKEIVQLLVRLNPSIPILPIGLLRQKAAPYVTSEGIVDFANPRIYRAAVNEVARNYREYFIELNELFRQWTIPSVGEEPLSEEAKRLRDDEAVKSESIRNAVAQVMGEVGKYDMGDIEGLLKEWATDSSAHIRKTLGIALRQAVLDSDGTTRTRALLGKWIRDPNPRIRWSAGSALWRIALTPFRDDLLEFAWSQLQEFAEKEIEQDDSSSLVDSAAYAIHQIARLVPADQLVSLISRLGVASNWHTRREVACTVQELARRNTEEARVLLETWLLPEQPAKLRETAAYTLLIWEKRTLLFRERRICFANLLGSADPLPFARALNIALSAQLRTGKDAKLATSAVRRLAARSPQASREGLVIALATVKRMEPALWEILSGQLAGLDQQDVNFFAPLLADIDAEFEVQKIENWSAGITGGSTMGGGAAPAIADIDRGLSCQGYRWRLLASIDNWLGAANEDLRSTALLVLLDSSQLSHEERCLRAGSLLQSDPTRFVTTLRLALNRGGDAATALLLVRELVANQREILVAGLVEVQQNDPDVVQNLSRHLSTVDQDRFFPSLLTEIDDERLSQKVAQYPAWLAERSYSSPARVKAARSVDAALANQRQRQRYMQMLDQWAASGDPNQRAWVLYLLIVGNNFSEAERFPRLLKLARADRWSFIKELFLRFDTSITLSRIASTLSGLARVSRETREP